MEGEKVVVNRRRREELQGFIADELFKAMGMRPDGWQRRIFGPLVSVPTRRFAELVTRFEANVSECGLQIACEKVLDEFVEGVKVRGVQHVPIEGPLLVVSNHPGAYDGLVLLANLPREDLKFVVSGVPLTQAVPILQERLIFTTEDVHERMSAARGSIRHLRTGGAILLFPGVLVEPDPACMSGATQTLSRWSASVEMMARRVSDLQVVVAIVSGVIYPRYLRHPLTYLGKTAWQRQRLAEYFQVMGQLVFTKKYPLSPYVTFSEPILTCEVDSNCVLKLIQDRARQLLDLHPIQ